MIFERSYVQNVLIKSVIADNSEYIALVKAINQDGDGAQSLLDFIDNFSFILDKCCKRALMSLSIVNTCSMFNFINEILNEQF